MGYSNAKGAVKVCSVPQGHHVVMGDIAGLTPVDILGYSGTITATISDLTTQAGAYAFMAAKAGLEVVSDSTSDAAAGTGARTVKIEYLDENYAAQTTTVTLNGTTAVATTPTNILRINKFYIATAGTGLAAAGNILLRGLSGGSTYAKIVTGDTMCRHGIYTVPAGKTLYISQAVLSIGIKVAAAEEYGRFSIRANQIAGAKVTGIFYPAFELITSNKAETIFLDQPLKFVEKVDVKISALSSVASGTVANAYVSGFLK